MAILGSLPNLEGLKLKNLLFDDSAWEPSEGEFPKLKFLLHWSTDLENWKANETHFPNLQRLCLGECTLLVEVPSGIEGILTL
ncbi:Hypothetical predicted protein [Olea europaea subsp. europaea]|uniref:Disease resistance protein n=1 Tax=Olea europaea subsp. europaea TaxID=158383 RepID=A0A8S0S6R6_OLEEU|nr:Hypothetical predicted protein [Olea europaea subsp. europaea]